MSQIAVLPGDGIGPEVTSAAVRVLAAVRPDIVAVFADVGGAALRKGDRPLPAATMKICAASAAILFGAVGLPEYEQLPLAERPEEALFSLRHDFDLFANLRPVKVFPGLETVSALRPEAIKGLDFIIVRELTSGIYFGQPKERRSTGGVAEAVDTMFYNAAQVERIARVAFDLAMRRRRRVTSVDKHNILATSGLWRDVINDVARDYPQVSVEHLLVDNAAMQIIRRPLDFDVIVTENMFGDILSDEAAMLTGSVGNLPSASLGPGGEPGRQFGMYEPISGTAPDIAGKGIANPTGAILSAALALRYSLSDDGSATRIERAVEGAFAGGSRTADLSRGAKGSLTTEQFTAAVVAQLEES
jgi:3-isopropylmalate dehydrogenase